MDPVLSQAVATLIGAIATAILLFASSMWGPNSRRRRDAEDDDDE
jgi:hypothetical protein